MIPLLKKLWESFLYDDMKVRRWLRAALMAMAGSGMAWGDQLSQILGTPQKTIKVATVACMAVAVAINLGEKNVVSNGAK